MPLRVMYPIDFPQALVTESFPTRTAGIHHLKNKCNIPFKPLYTILLQALIKP